MQGLSMNRQSKRILTKTQGIAPGKWARHSLPPRHPGRCWPASPACRFTIVRATPAASCQSSPSGNHAPPEVLPLGGAFLTDAPAQPFRATRATG